MLLQVPPPAAIFNSALLWPFCSLHLKNNLHPIRRSHTVSHRFNVSILTVLSPPFPLTASFLSLHSHHFLKILWVSSFQQTIPLHPAIQTRPVAWLVPIISEGGLECYVLLGRNTPSSPAILLLVVGVWGGGRVAEIWSNGK